MPTLSRRDGARVVFGFCAALVLFVVVGCNEPVQTETRPQRFSNVTSGHLLVAQNTAPPAAQTADSPTAKLPKVKKNDQSNKLFDEFLIPKFRFEIAEPSLQILRNDPRKYARAALKVATPDGEQAYAEVGVRLKGAAGSFRGVDDRPALTINFDKFKNGQEFYGLDKIHLNNSVQDSGLINELLCGELMLANKVPTARATHAQVWINNRDLGFYVLKEGYDVKFLERHFGNAQGNFYDGGFLQEIDGNLKKDSGEGVNDRGDLKALVEACREPDPVKRQTRLEAALDVDEFCRFMALELICSHWDGYVNNRNNYRIYFNPANGGRAVFIPHGMDQMFGDPNAKIFGGGGLVAQAILNTPELRAKYRDAVDALLPQFSPADKLVERLDLHRKRIVAAVKLINEGQANGIDQHLQGLKNQLVERSKSLVQQNSVQDPRPLKFDASGVALVGKWAAKKETDDAKLEAANNGRGLLIQTGNSNRCVASWRTKVILTQGKYRFEGRIKTTGVQPLEDQSGSGAGVRLSGGRRENKAVGDTDWTVLVHEFDIPDAQREVELVIELRAVKGEALFDTQHLKLVKAK